MFGLFTKSRSSKYVKPLQKTIRLSLEALETRDCPSAPSLYNMSAAAVGNHQVRVSGYLVTDNTDTINFSGATSGTQTAGYGPFNFTANGNPGTVSAVAVDQNNLTSSTATTTVSPPASTSYISNFTIQSAGGRYVSLSGQLTSWEQANSYVRFTGAVTATAVTDANGNFSVVALASSLGSVTASFTDSWGMTGYSAYSQVVCPPPNIVNFKVVSEPNNAYVFSGTVIDAAGTQGMVVTFSGLPELQGQKTILDAQGNFEIGFTLASGEYGNITAQTVDAWGQSSSPASTYVSA